MTQWMVLIPRPLDVASTVDVDKKPSLVDQAKAWISKSEGKLSENNIVCAGANLPGTLLASPDARLYVMGGHGKEGRNHLSWPGESNPLCCHQLGDVLAAAGLPQTFAGQIKVYSCLSADSKGSAVAFAKLFAQYMAHLGYRSCKIWGYTGAVSKGYVNSGSADAPLGMVDKLKFKIPAELGKGFHRYATVTGGYGTRAKDAKKDFTLSPTAAVTLAHCNVCHRF